ncbi:MAG: FAD-linked oxidase C-terminal domain-containing protein [Anaerolineae bacterium]
MGRALDPVARAHMLRLKRLFDPHNILNPGKIFAETER